ncbi:hypothetical protein ASPZODRAFT_1625336 [Penicilliopsis zonata CBS 506.65]|uniref:Uncharacterized protein n=1 Tax=Penicilliopsis zonata CBS 506.65 TaxID=1073090 RepID=A0A1L9SN93_9EURO|nr:hypothetical protein ASPZODRAFT_1625336 [Penicilliopsis zonata CBS 506.65]OJJ48571.1 hypothetical protein ASPZODRAFT_1625336 [Penicilliopsis zonata CBS 506.65]
MPIPSFHKPESVWNRTNLRSSCQKIRLTRVKRGALVTGHSTHHHLPYLFSSQSRFYHSKSSNNASDQEIDPDGATSTVSYSSAASWLSPPRADVSECNKACSVDFRVHLPRKSSLILSCLNDPCLLRISPHSCHRTWDDYRSWSTAWVRNHRRHETITARGWSSREWLNIKL